MASIRVLTNPRVRQMMAQLAHKNLSTCWRRNFGTKPIQSKNCFRTVNRILVVNQKSLFHTSPKRYNPIVALVIRNVAKFAAVVTGRAIRKWWSELPPDKRRAFMAWLWRNKGKFAVALAAVMAGFAAYYLSHISETPMTKRKRFLAFTPKQLKQLNDYELEVQLEMFKHKLLPATHQITKRVARVATQLLNANNDLAQIHDHEWSVSVVDDANVKNAFVLPSGHIFVFTGMLAMCDNDQQLGVVLAHEMAHAVLAHSAEMVSHAHLVDLFFICLLAIIWTILPSDWTAAITSGISRFIMGLILDSPYSRMLETEADIAGLQLAAKACFDVRETSAFWHKMAIIENTQGIQFTQDDISIPVKTEFLSTHPSHETRYQYLDSIMDHAIELRRSCNCPPLPRYDPRITIETLKKSIEDYHRSKRRDGIIILPKPPVPPHLQKS